MHILLSYLRILTRRQKQRQLLSWLHPFIFPTTQEPFEWFWVQTRAVGITSENSSIKSSCPECRVSCFDVKIEYFGNFAGVSFEPLLKFRKLFSRHCLFWNHFGLTLDEARSIAMVCFLIFMSTGKKRKEVQFLISLEVTPIAFEAFYWMVPCENK